VLGAVASGKSTVARMMAEHGAEVIDADRIGHEVLGRPAVAEEVRRTFGPDVFDAEGDVVRARLAGVVFDRPDRLAELNAIVHPPICREVERQVREYRCRAGVPMVVLDAALLLETELSPYCDLLVFVETGEDARRSRARTGRGWTTEDLARREAAQVSEERKRCRADVVLPNNGSLDQLRESVRGLVREIRERFHIPPDWDGDCAGQSARLRQ
jgi:dephospho-CoA kinase